MAGAYSTAICGISNPRVGLLSIGEEDAKGTDIVKEARTRMREEPLINFIGNIEGLDIPIWILGSSLFGAQLAAMLGLPYAFASHFAPQMMMEAIAVYRDRFEPSEQLDRPYVMLGFNALMAVEMPPIKPPPLPVVSFWPQLMKTGRRRAPLWGGQAGGFTRVAAASIAPDGGHVFSVAR